MRSLPVAYNVGRFSNLVSFVRRPALHGMATCFVVVCCILLAAPARGAFVLAPDNGGTATMPPVGQDYDGGLMQIINGLPLLTTIDIPTPVFGGFFNVVEVAGGSYLGGTTSQYGSAMQVQMQGIGVLAGFNRFIFVPLPAGANNYMDFAARTPFTSPQSFDASLMRMSGEVFGDPDFDLLRITAGNDFGLPSPGHTTLTDMGGGQWNVDSFFDITYRIDFVGAPGSVLQGLSGSTTGTARFQMGMPIPEPSTLIMSAIGAVGIGLVASKRRRPKAG